MEFVGYDTCDNLIWTSGEVSRTKNKIIKQGSPKKCINKISPSSTFGFSCYPHRNTCDIFSKYLVSSRIQAFFKVGIVLEYINRVKSRHGIWIPTTCVYQKCFEKTGFNVRAMLAKILRCITSAKQHIA